MAQEGSHAAAGSTLLKQRPGHPPVAVAALFRDGGDEEMGDEGTCQTPTGHQSSSFLPGGAAGDTQMHRYARTAADRPADLSRSLRDPGKWSVCDVR